MTSHAVDYDALWQGAWGDQQKYGPIHRHQRRILKRLLQGRSFQSVLDLGCGEGSNLLYLLKEFPQIRRAVGVDVSERALEQARTLLPGVTLQRLDAQHEALPERFDLIYSSDVIEHVPDDLAFLTQARRMTAGVFLVGTLQGRMRAFEHTIGHVRNYRPGELREKCVAAGFNVVQELNWGWPFYSPLYRNLNDTAACQSAAAGSYGPAKILLCHLLYHFFRLNLSSKGDIIWLACEVAPE